MSQAQEIPAIYKAMTGILNDLNPIGKDKANKEQGFKYRGIDDLYNALWPLLAKHGVFTLPRVLEHSSVDRMTKSGGCMESVTLKIRYQFCASDGSSVECEVVSEGRDLADKAFNKAMAAGHKYALLQTFCIPTEEGAKDDPDRETPDPIYPQNNRQSRQQTKPPADPPDPNAMTAAQRKALMAYLTKRHGDDRGAYLSELSSFFGRTIGSSKELTRTNVSEFLEAVNHGAQHA